MKALLSFLEYLAEFMLFLFIVAALVSMCAGCSSKPVDLRESYVNFRQFTPGGREPLLPEGARLDKEVNLHVNTDIMRYGYWNNKVWSVTDQGQFRLIGWNYKLGVRLTPFLDLEAEHFSKHRLESTWVDGFPVQDSVGFNLYFFKRDLSPSILGGK